MRTKLGLGAGPPGVVLVPAAFTSTMYNVIGSVPRPYPAEAPVDRSLRRRWFPSP
ncbi:hypothetical protein BZL30_8887 [Mycobacterium kansasii]|uniref:Uncharacterized protein n=1 Tax=Mycobacterium kansasii TaxID=1768 RepID=A0A1V3WD50_MYCKA|nr:hypothetical protein BZL30_8887 [Mycobacterium kansasii]